MSGTIPSYSDPSRTFHPGGAPSISSESVSQGGVPQSLHQQGEANYHSSQQQSSGQYAPSLSSQSHSPSGGLVHQETHFTHPEQLRDTHSQHIAGIEDEIPVHTLNISESAPPPVQHHHQSYHQQPQHQQQRYEQPPAQQYQQQQPQINTPTFAAAPPPPPQTSLPSNPQPNYAPSTLTQTTLTSPTSPNQHLNTTNLNRSASQSSHHHLQPSSPTVAVVPGPALPTPGQFLHQGPVSPRGSVEDQRRAGAGLGPSGALSGQLFPISAFVIKQSGAYSSHAVVNWRTTDGRAGQTERLGPSLGLGLAIRSLKDKGIPEGAHVQLYLDVTLGKSCLAAETFVYQELAPTCALYQTGGTTLSKDKLSLIFGDE